MKRLILLAHDKKDEREYYRNLLCESERGYEVDTASCGEEAIAKAAKHEYGVIILDVLMPNTRVDESAGRCNQLGGIYALEKIRQLKPWVPVIMFSYKELSDEIMDQARALNIFDYLVRYHSHSDLKLVTRVNNAEEIYLERKKSLAEHSEIIYKSSRMESAVLKARTVARSDTPVLILGETGVGKELIADEIYKASPRNGKPFLQMNCAAIPETLIESEIFGHEQGSFTGAISKRRGLLELSDKGVLFLDEIGDMALSTQAKLLRAIEEQEFRPVGSEKTLKVDVRIICATNKNLEEMVRKEQFRDDLYYRICNDKIMIPPLRERTEDIGPLVEAFTNEFNRKYHRQIKVDAKVVKRLESYPLPGNVRELKSIIFAGLSRLYRNEETLTENHLECRIFTDEAVKMVCDTGLIPENKLQEQVSLGCIDLDKFVDDIRERCVRIALEKSNHNAEKAAQLLKINPHTLRRWVREDKGDAKPEPQINTD
ncbi:MAG: sigma-54-dependent Fis family transcriptional regulator [Planctomycetes bacterium]|nr:sigma-54-dependent Fis family transcriptional regulator [Planctomycetota bacterium]